MNLTFLELKVHPPIVLFAVAGFMWLVSAAAPWAAVSLPFKNLLAAAVAAVSSLLAIPSFVAFFAAKTTIHPDKPERTSTLVVTGAYAITRNPMYLSLLILLVAWAVYLSSVSAALLVPLFPAYLNRFQIGPEERILKARFGAQYEEYARRVRRWI